MQTIQETLKASLEDFSISRSERQELKSLLVLTQGDRAKQAKIRQLAFKMAAETIKETGKFAAMDWLESVTKLLYSKEIKIKASAYFSPGKDCLNRINRFILILSSM